MRIYKHLRLHSQGQTCATKRENNMKGSAATGALLISTALLGSANTALAQPAGGVHTTTAAQQATADQVAQQGVPIAALSPQAPETYTVQRGDTLWRIAGLFLRQPWHWPQLWGMNKHTIANPHWIYPGQVLYLERNGGYARLSTARSGEIPTIKLSPSVRSESLSDMALPTLQMHIIEAFLTQPLVVDSNTLEHAPRIIASDNERIMLAQGDRAYVRGSAQAPLLASPDTPSNYRLFRQAVPLKDPITQQVLGYEAQYLGQANLLRGQTPAAPEQAAQPTDASTPYAPATIRITTAKEEIRPGDRLLPEPERQYLNFVPHAPQQPVTAHVVSLYGSTAIRYGAQHQVIAINKGQQDGMQPGMVLALQTKGAAIIDKTDPHKARIQLPDEENGLAMVFRSFDRVSYALIMDVKRGVQVGDTLIGAQ